MDREHGHAGFAAVLYRLALPDRLDAAAEAAVWHGEHPDRPFVMVCQQSQFDPARAPAGKHTGYAYCHVPGGSTVDQAAQI